MNIWEFNKLPLFFRKFFSLLYENIIKEAKHNDKHYINGACNYRARHRIDVGHGSDRSDRGRWFLSNQVRTDPADCRADNQVYQESFEQRRLIFSTNKRDSQRVSFFVRMFYSLYCRGAGWLGYARPGLKCPNCEMV